jgi:hypothetical protein
MSIVFVALPLSHTNAHPSLPGNESGNDSGNKIGNSGNKSGKNLSLSSHCANQHTVPDPQSAKADFAARGASRRGFNRWQRTHRSLYPIRRMICMSGSAGCPHRSIPARVETHPHDHHHPL